MSWVQPLAAGSAGAGSQVGDGSAARAARAPQEVDDAASAARPGPAKLESQPCPQDGQRRRRRVMGRCLSAAAPHGKNLNLSPVRRTAPGRRRCFVVRIGAGAGGSRVDAMRDANVHGICSLKRGPTQIYVEKLP